MCWELASARFLPQKSNNFMHPEVEPTFEFQILYAYRFCLRCRKNATYTISLNISKKAFYLPVATLRTLHLTLQLISAVQPNRYSSFFRASNPKLLLPTYPEDVHYRKRHFGIRPKPGQRCPALPPVVRPIRVWGIPAVDNGVWGFKRDNEWSTR